MKRFRIGNDITINWETDTSLEDMVVKFYMTHPKGREEITEFTIDGSTLSYTFPGLKQKTLGRYTFTMDVRRGDDSRLFIKDKCGVFELVGRSCVESDDAGEINYTIDL